MKNKAKFKEWIAMFSERYDKEISKASAGVLWEALRPFDDKVCEKAMKHVFLTGKYFTNMLPDIIDALTGSVEAKAVSAWLLVDKTVKSHGPYQSVQFEDTVIHAVINAMGGWPKFQDCAGKEWVWKQKEFERLYRIISERDDHPKYLPGLTEIANNSEGYQNQRPGPALIASHDKKKQITSGEEL